MLGFMYRAATTEAREVPDVVAQLRRAASRDIALLLRDIAHAMRLEHLPAITVHTRDSAGDTPLHYAVYWGDVRAIEMLAAAGAEVDAAGEYGATPLFCGVLHGRYAAARSLLGFGASPHVPSAFGTPADAAAPSQDLRMRSLFQHAATTLSAEATAV
jgi:ankyrin repeat protein